MSWSAMFQTLALRRCCQFSFSRLASFDSSTSTSYPTEELSSSLASLKIDCRPIEQTSECTASRSKYTIGGKTRGSFRSVPASFAPALVDNEIQYPAVIAMQTGRKSRPDKTEGEVIQRSRKIIKGITMCVGRDQLDHHPVVTHSHGTLRYASSPNPSSNADQTLSKLLANPLSLLANPFIFSLNKLAALPHVSSSVPFSSTTSNQRNRDVLERKNHCNSCQTHHLMNSLLRFRPSINRLSVSIEVESFS